MENYNSTTTETSVGVSDFGNGNRNEKGLQKKRKKSKNVKIKTDYFDTTAEFVKIVTDGDNNEEKTLTVQRKDVPVYANIISNKTCGEMGERDIMTNVLNSPFESVTDKSYHNEPHKNTNRSSSKSRESDNKGDTTSNESASAPVIAENVANTLLHTPNSDENEISPKRSTSSTRSGRRDDAKPSSPDADAKRKASDHDDQDGKPAVEVRDVGTAIDMTTLDYGMSGNCGKVCRQTCNYALLEKAYRSLNTCRQIKYQYLAKNPSVRAHLAETYGFMDDAEEKYSAPLRKSNKDGMHRNEGKERVYLFRHGVVRK